MFFVKEKTQHKNTLRIGSRTSIIHTTMRIRDRLQIWNIWRNNRRLKLANTNFIGQYFQVLKSQTQNENNKTLAKGSTASSGLNQTGLCFQDSRRLNAFKW